MRSAVVGSCGCSTCLYGTLLPVYITGIHDILVYMNAESTKVPVPAWKRLLPGTPCLF